MDMNSTETRTQIAKFMGPTWGSPGSCWPQMGPMLAPCTSLSGNWWYLFSKSHELSCLCCCHLWPVWLWMFFLTHNGLMMSCDTKDIAELWFRLGRIWKKLNFSFNQIWFQMAFAKYQPFCSAPNLPELSFSWSSFKFHLSQKPLEINVLGIVIYGAWWPFQKCKDAYAVINIGS